MIPANPSNSAKRKNPSMRPLTLASVVSFVIAVAVVAIAGPLSYRALISSSLISSVHAADTVQPTSGFADLVAKVKPAVISVRVRIERSTGTNSIGQSEGNNPFPPDSPMERFFQQFGFPNLPNGIPQTKQLITGLGSGFFISADGYAVTNNHVVDHAKTVQITTDDGATHKAKVIGTDPKTDLALIKVDADKTFPYVKFAEREPRIGDWVVSAIRSA
jgi:serine protease Do